MLPKKNRLKRKKDFQRVFQKGRGIKEGVLVFKWLPNSLKENRFGIIVSQKVSKKAVSRNKIRRRLQAHLRLKLSKFKKNLDGVIIVQPGAKEEKKETILDSLNKIFQRAKLIKENGKNNC